MTIPSRLLAASDGLSSAAILASLLLPARPHLLRLPEVTRQDADGLEADLFLPAQGPSPGIVLALGALREGRRYDLLQQAARSIASCGFAVLVPELGRLRRLILDQDAVHDLVEAALTLPQHDGVSNAPIGLIGFSLGGSLALLAADDARIRDHVAFVAAMGAYFRLEDVLSAAGAGFRAPGGESLELEPPSKFAIAASLVATLRDPDRQTLDQALEGGRDSPLEVLSRVDMESVGPQAKRVLALLRNRDPGRVAPLIDAIDGMAATLGELSPESVIGRLQCPVWLLHDERDRYVPFSQFELMSSAAAGRPNFTFLAIRLLEHTEPLPPMINPLRLLGDYLPGLVKLFRFVHGPLSALRHAAVR